MNDYSKTTILVKVNYAIRTVEVVFVYVALKVCKVIHFLATEDRFHKTSITHRTTIVLPGTAGLYISPDTGSIAPR